MQHLRRLWHLAHTDIMLQNSLFIMASTGIMAVFGFAFWLINTHIYTTEQIGLASTLIAVTANLSLFSQLGFDNVLVRFLPTAPNREQVINTALIIATLASTVTTLIFMAALPIISPQLNAVVNTPLHGLLFVIAMAFITINTLTDSIFIAYQSAKYIFLADAFLSLAKLVLPLGLLSLGAFGLFFGFAGAIILAALISLAILSRQFHYRLHPSIHWPTLRLVATYSTGTYLASLSEALPLVALPILVTNLLGARPAAFFYAAVAIAGLLFIIPRATAHSLFAASSHHAAAFTEHLRRTLHQTSLILLPAIATIYLLAPWLLRLFGPAYAQASTPLLRLLAISAIPLGYNHIAAVRPKLMHQTHWLVGIQASSAAIIIALAPSFMHANGLMGAGWAWLIGQCFASGLFLLNQRQTPAPVSTATSLL